MTAIPPRPGQMPPLPPGSGVGRVFGAVSLSGQAPVGPTILQGQVTDGVLETSNGQRISLSNLPQAASDHTGKIALYIPAEGEGQAVLFKPEVGMTAKFASPEAIRAVLDRALFQQHTASSSTTGGQIGDKPVTYAASVIDQANSPAIRTPLIASAQVVAGALPEVLGRVPAVVERLTVSLALAAQDMGEAVSSRPVPTGAVGSDAVRAQVTARHPGGVVELSGQQGLKLTAILPEDGNAVLKQSLQPGQTVELRIAKAVQGQALPVMTAAPLNVLARQWPLLTNLLNMASPVDDTGGLPVEGASSAEPASLPLLLPGQGGAPKLALGMAALMQLAQTGQLASVLARHLPDLPSLQMPASLDKLASEASRMSFQAVGRDGERWQGVTLPMIGAGRGDGLQIEFLQAFFRPMDMLQDQGPSSGQDSHDQRGAEKPKGTRFLINISFDRLGLIQFDGIARTGQLDINLRHAKPLSEQVLGKVKALYVNALQVTGLTGKLICIGETVPMPTPVSEASGSDGWNV
ncbi:MAG: hypothetical protein Alpg2KO_32800 [Alphaproteobacteria bacterium]